MTSISSVWYPRVRRSLLLSTVTTNDYSILHEAPRTKQLGSQRWQLNACSWCWEFWRSGPQQPLAPLSVNSCAARTRRGQTHWPVSGFSSLTQKVGVDPESHSPFRHFMMLIEETFQWKLYFWCVFYHVVVTDGGGHIDANMKSTRWFFFISIEITTIEKNTACLNHTKICFLRFYLTQFMHKTQ